MIIKSLIAIRDAFIDGECRYVLNDLYINDYCVWIQYVRYLNFRWVCACSDSFNIYLIRLIKAIKSYRK